MKSTVERIPVECSREPITGLREPIVGIRQAIHMNDPLNWDDCYNKFNNYIKYAAKQVSEQTQNFMASAEDLYQEGLLLLWKCFEQYKYKDFQQFCYIFKASVWRQMRNQGHKFEPITEDIEEAYDIGYSDDTLEQIYDEYRMKQVMDLLKDAPVALDILTELIAPSKKTFQECDLDIARKEMVRNQGHKINVPNTLEVKGIHIQRALNLTKEIYVENLRLIQKIVYRIYSPDTQIRNYSPTPEELAESFNEPVQSEYVKVNSPAMEDRDVIHLIQNLADLISDELCEKDVTSLVVNA